MIDTIVVEIPIDFRAIIEGSRFTPNAQHLQTYNGFVKCTNNRRAEDRANNVYKPKLTLFKRGIMLILKVEFSAPKMIFNNNLDEVEDSDFSELVNRLQSIVKGMGVLLNISQIENAKVTGFHPSKNIILTNGYTVSFALRELYKINLSQKMDLTQTDFRNEGEEIQLYANSHSVVFYDKINDLTKPPKRAADKDQPLQQRDLFEFIQTNKKGLEILRIEIRLKNKKMQEVLAEVGFTQPLTLKNILRKELCQKVVNFYWERLFGKNLFIFNTYSNPQRILEMILEKYPKTKIRTAVMLVGLNLLCRDDDGFRGFRKIVEGYKEKKDWLALKRYLDKISDEFFEKPRQGFIDDITRSLGEFESYKIKK